MSYNKIEKQLIQWQKEKKIKSDYLKIGYDDLEYIKGIKNKEIFNFVENNPGEINIVLGFVDSAKSTTELKVYYDGNNITLESEDVNIEPSVIEIDFPTGELIIGDNLKFLGFDPDLRYNLYPECIKTMEIFAEQGFMYAYTGKSYPNVYQDNNEKIIFGRMYTSKEEALKEMSEKDFSESMITSLEEKFYVSTDYYFTGIIDKQVLYLLAEKNLGLTQTEIDNMIKNNLEEDWNTINVAPGKYRFINNYIVEGTDNPLYLSMEKTGEVNNNSRIKLKKEYEHNNGFLMEYLNNEYFDIYPNFLKFLLNSKLRKKQGQNYLDLNTYHIQKDSDNKKIEEFIHFSDDIKDLIRDTPVFNYNTCFLEAKYGSQRPGDSALFNDNERGHPFDMVELLSSIDNKNCIEYSFYLMVMLKTVLENSKETLYYSRNEDLNKIKKDIGKSLIVCANIIKKEEGFQLFALLKNEFTSQYELSHFIHPGIIKKETAIVDSLRPFLDNKGIKKEDAIRAIINEDYGIMAKYTLPNKKSGMHL